MNQRSFCFPLTATHCGDEPSGDADRPGSCVSGSDEPGAGHVQSSSYLQPLLRLQRLSKQKERPRRRSRESGESKPGE